MDNNGEDLLHASAERESTIKDIWQLTQQANTGVDLNVLNDVVEYKRQLREEKVSDQNEMFDAAEPMEAENESTRANEASVNLQKSLHLLDMAMGTPGRMLRGRASLRKPSTHFSPECSFGVPPDGSVVSGCHDAASMLVQAGSRLNWTSTDESVLPDECEEDTLDDIYAGFLKSLVDHRSEHQIFELLDCYETLCSDRVTALKKVVHGQVPGQARHLAMTKLLSTLSDEKATWSLVSSLYKDRLRTDTESESPTTTTLDDMCKYQSEKEVVDELYARDPTIRQAQIVIDWLERVAAEVLDEYYDQVEFFTDQMGAWENTLHALTQQKTGVATRTMRPIVRHMDPDAPIREGLPLADLDVEDEHRLLKYLFTCVRAGQLDQAQKLCVRVGQAWRAASLEGWKLHHDPNYSSNGKPDPPVAPQGNGQRDVWKSVCWRMAEEEKFSTHERALYATFSGHLARMLPACTTWLDWLWAHMRTLVDVRMEQEVRINSRIVKQWQTLPQQYWKHSFSLDSIFHELETSHNQAIQAGSREHYHIIQKYIILDDIGGLIEEMYGWCRKDKISPQLLRFIAHIVLFLRTTGVETKEELCVSILESYVKLLIDEKRVNLVAMYTATLPQDVQVECYAKFLEGITETDARRACLQLGAEAGLDVDAATKMLVERIRSADVTELSMHMHLTHDAATTDEDRKMISAVDWLIFNPCQRAEALKQANALMRTFIGTKKLAAARELFNKLPPGSIDLIIREWKAQTGSSDLCAEDENAIREYLSIQAYLDANDSFNDWFEHNHNARPKEPDSACAANFSERVAYEHRMQRYENEVQRWKHTLKLQTKTTVDKLYNVLMFVDGGWMVDQRTDGLRDTSRTHQLRLLRQLCLPPLCMLLHTVLHTTENYRECLQLADVIASEHHQLYRVFRRDELQSLLQRIHSSSLMLLEQGFDSLGYQINA